MLPKSRHPVVSVVAAVALLALVLVPLDLGRSRAQPRLPDEEAAVTGRRPVVQTAGAAAAAKIAPPLRAAAADPAQAERRAVILVKSTAPLDLSAYVAQSASTPWVFGQTLTLASVRVGTVLKIAGLPEVESVEESTERSLRQPLGNPDPQVPRLQGTPEERRQRLMRLRAIDLPWSQVEARDRLRHPDKPGGAQPSGWWDVGAGHNSRTAWNKGWRGEGVKVAVLDDSVDFAHPDLQGTWATVQIPGSPYDGWVQAFDPWSLYAYVQDRTVGVKGQEYGWLGGSRFISTTQTAVATQSWDERDSLLGHACFIPLYDTPGGALQGVRGASAVCDWRVFKYEVLPNGNRATFSRSGIYRFGNHPDFDWLGELYGERVGVLLVDRVRAGVYDTVYVDLDNDHDFTDEKPVTKSDPLVYRDMDGDGWPDLSGGALHFIADGSMPLPGSYMYGDLAPPPPAWSVVAFTGSFELGDHGTLCASNIAGQGRLPVAEDLPLLFSDLPGNQKPASPVQGAAPGAKIVAVSDVYLGPNIVFETAWQYVVRGHDPNRAEDDIQISSNSYGFLEQDYRGWDVDSRFIDRLVRTFNPSHAYVKATGNGGPGYGTTTRPAPHVGIQVAASTQFGSTGWDSITRTDQIVYGDIIPFSNRGPVADGMPGATVAADGAFAAGARAINNGFDGAHAWYSWGGTSRATPVTAGNLALVYQAFKAKHDRWPSWEEARALLMAGATHRGYDTATQGAGVVDGGRAALVAGGVDGIYAQPAQWVPGGYRGQKYPAFASLMSPGREDSATLTLTNAGNHTIDAQLSAQRLRRIATSELEWTSQPITSETPYHFVLPDYVIPIDQSRIPAGTELMVVRASFPLAEFDLTTPPRTPWTPDGVWRLLVYQHTDVDGDGRLWEDRDGDEVVDKATLDGAPSPYADGYAAVDWAAGEMDRYEYMRMGYDNGTNNNLQMFVHHPLERWADGLYIGLQHTGRPPEIGRTHFTLRIDCYRYQPWGWVNLSTGGVSVPAGGSARFQATLRVPEGTALGAYDGAILASYRGNVTDIGDHTLVIPVGVNVASAFDLTGSVEIGGAAAGDPDSPYSNGSMRGAFRWNWRPEAAEWRYAFVDVTRPAPPGGLLLTRNRWQDEAGQSDIDTLIFGPQRDRYSDPDHPANAQESWADPAWYGPYTLRLVQGSVSRYLGAGRWAFDTATDGSEEWVASAAAEGLHEVVLHNVLVSGRRFEVPYTFTLSSAEIEPTALRVQGQGCRDFRFRSGMDLPGLNVAVFGMSEPTVVRDAVVGQDNPDDRSTSSFQTAITVTHASRLEVVLDGRPGNDLDMVLLLDRNGDGTFSYPAEMVAESTSPEADERIALRRPEDGRYAVWVHGWSVPGGSTTMNLHVVAPSGTDLRVQDAPSGPVPAGRDVTFQVCYDLSGAPSRGVGEVVLGPPAVDGLFAVPVGMAAPIYLPAALVRYPRGGGEQVGLAELAVPPGRRP